MEAVGGTNINQALLAALEADPRDDARPYLIVFMTDGEPTVDVTDPGQILKNVAEKNSRRVRFHVLGVGTEVNTHLLDKLAEMNRGTRDYCTENEELELKLSAFVGRLANPVLTDIVLKIDGLRTSDVYPQQIPDLFRGNDILVLGRYEGDGHRAVKVTGRLPDETATLTYEGEFPERNSHNDFLPRLWANRKVAYLLDQIRLHGRSQELVDEVIRLATRYGIVTPYTSALILEDERQLAFGVHATLGGQFRDLARRGAPGPRGGAGRLGTATGGIAVTESRDLAQSMALGYVGLEEATEAGFVDDFGHAVIRRVGDKTFVLAEGRYVDSTWDGKAQPKKITAFSDEYFELLRAHPQLAPYLAIAERVLTVFEGQVYEIVPG